MPSFNRYEQLKTVEAALIICTSGLHYVPPASKLMHAFLCTRMDYGNIKVSRWLKRNLYSPLSWKRQVYYMYTNAWGTEGSKWWNQRITIDQNTAHACTHTPAHTPTHTHTPHMHIHMTPMWCMQTIPLTKWFRSLSGKPSKHLLALPWIHDSLSCACLSGYN